MRVRLNLLRCDCVVCREAPKACPLARDSRKLTPVGLEGDADGVLCELSPRRMGALGGADVRADWRCLREGVAIRGRGLAAAGVPARDVWKPRPENGGLDLVQPAVDALGDMAIAVGLAVLAHQPKAFIELGVVRHDGPAVPEGGEVLRRIEAEAPEGSDRAGRPATELGS